MNYVEANFKIGDTVWKAEHIEELAYQRNLHVLHQMREHGVEIKDGEKRLTDDDIDYLTKKKSLGSLN